MLFGGSAPASYQRMAKWGEGYINGSLPVAAVAPFFDSARQAWRETGREGSPKLVAIAYFVFGNVEQGRRDVRDYYAAIGADYAAAIVEAIHVGSAAVRAAVESSAPSAPTN
jgi:alkanesulfonate monooxygenase SsuD/methylene tetrahydromethanopterin reductase-like flavin-dependent oxidoreductase (luciferase family)